MGCGIVQKEVVKGVWLLLNDEYGLVIGVEGNEGRIGDRVWEFLEDWV